MWLLPGIIAPVLPEVASAISSLGTPTPAMIGACLLCVLHVEGKPLMNFNEAVAKGCPGVLCSWWRPPACWAAP